MEKQNHRIQPRETYHIVAEGPTENALISFLLNTRLDKNNVTLVPRLPKHSGYKQIFKEVKAKLKQNPYVKVIVIIDADTLTGDKEYESQKSSLIEKFRERLIILETSPCLEFFFLLSEKETDKPFNDCDGAVRELKVFWPDYRKGKESKKSFEKHLTIDKLNTAIVRAIKFYPGVDGKSHTQLHLLLVLLGRSFADKQSLETFIRENLPDNYKHKKLYYVYWQKDDRFRLAFYSGQYPVNLARKLKAQMFEVMQEDIELYVDKLEL